MYIMYLQISISHLIPQYPWNLEVDTIIPNHNILYHMYLHIYTYQYLIFIHTVLKTTTFLN